jgi:hypothetical protein
MNENKECKTNGCNLDRPVNCIRSMVFIWARSNRQHSSSEVIKVACVGDSLTQSSGYPYDLWMLFGAKAPYTVGNYTLTFKNLRSRNDEKISKKVIYVNI